MITDTRLALLLGVSALAILGIFSLPPIQQDVSYHAFADRRNIAHIPNFFNVVSNLPFLAIGVAGIHALLTRKPSPDSRITHLLYLAFFTGIVLTGLGSGYYHWHPDNTTLAWDRLPMAATFTAFFSLVVAQCISPRVAAALFMPFLTLGIASVCYWRFSELQGHGDLRPYAVIQFLPIVLLPLILWLYEGASKGCAYVWGVLGAYLLAKIAETFDAQLYGALIFISGHTVKHLVASLGAALVYRSLPTNGRPTDGAAR